MYVGVVGGVLNRTAQKRLFYFFSPDRGETAHFLNFLDLSRTPLWEEAIRVPHQKQFFPIVHDKLDQDDPVIDDTDGHLMFYSYSHPKLDRFSDETPCLPAQPNLRHSPVQSPDNNQHEELPGHQPEQTPVLTSPLENPQKGNAIYGMQPELHSMVPQYLDSSGLMPGNGITGHSAPNSPMNYFPPWTTWDAPTMSYQSPVVSELFIKCNMHPQTQSHPQGFSMSSQNLEVQSQV